MSHFTETGYWQIAKPYKSEQSMLTSLPNTPASEDDGIQALRLRLQSLNAWPEAGDTFLELLDQVRGHGGTVVSADYDWLVQVADDACQGKDIGLHYPSIFQKLLTFPDFRQKFLQTLQIRSADV